MSVNRGEAAATPLAAEEFVGLMRALGPFESMPYIAVACSGGADSLALTLLADEWARARNGRATALIVDHGLRPEAADEAARVSRWLTALDVDNVVLALGGGLGTANLQAAARHARFVALRDWCRSAGVLHLLLAHHRRDQAETLMLRLARGSGVDGLAAMAPVHELPEVRVLRPLLDIAPARLSALLESRRQPFVDDPSNRDRAFARVRMRSLMPALTREGAGDARLAGTARRMARARAALESAATALLAEAAEIYPQGYATVASSRLLAAPEEIGLRALARLLACIGGAAYGGRLERLERLHAWLGQDDAGAGRTLGGCRVLRRGGNLLICREPSAVEPARPARDGVVWDGRFRLLLREAAPQGARIGALGRDGWSRVVAERPELAAAGLPAAVRPALPALLDLDGVLAVPHLSYRRDRPTDAASSASAIAFQPTRQLGAAAFVAGAAYA